MSEKCLHQQTLCAHKQFKYVQGISHDSLRSNHNVLQCQVAAVAMAENSAMQE